MAAKRPASPSLIANPFVKKRNLGWTLDAPTASQPSATQPRQSSRSPVPSSTAAVEAGTATITDHLAHFTDHLAHYALPPPSAAIITPTTTTPPTPRLPLCAYAALYESQAGSPRGAHFVVHQHDHPVAGTHYDLRLQINASSSASWAVMYGLPGDANSGRLNRNATETRVHCLWNHLIETASASTGSLLIWDTGTYTVLPRRSKHAPALDPSSPPDSPSGSPDPSPQSLLHAAFQSRKIRLRLHGTRLPDPYVLNLRLTKTEDAAGRARSGRAPRGKQRSRRRRGVTAETQPETSSDSESAGEHHDDDDDDVAPADGAAASDPDEDEHVRRTNAYPGASNTIGSVHQRRWYLSLDRAACGFMQRRSGGGYGRTWEMPRPPAVDEPGNAGDELGSVEDELGSARANRLQWPFYVRGAAHERSVVTGRTGADVLRDEGVKDFVPRRGWMPVLG